MRNANAIINRAEALSREYEPFTTHTGTEGMKFVGASSDVPQSGTTRAVLVDEDNGIVYKALWSIFPDRSLMSENIREWEIYSCVGDEIRSMLTKPLYISENGRVIVMEMVEPFPSYPTKEIVREVERFFEKMENLNLDTAGELRGDDCTFNFGRNNEGDVVMLDYACVTYSYCDEGDEGDEWGNEDKEEKPLPQELIMRINLGVI